LRTSQPMAFAVGDDVSVIGLSRRADLNGASGAVMAVAALHPHVRLEVRLWPLSMYGTETVSVRPDNLERRVDITSPRSVIHEMFRSKTNPACAFLVRDFVRAYTAIHGTNIDAHGALLSAVGAAIDEKRDLINKHGAFTVEDDAQEQDDADEIALWGKRSIDGWNLEIRTSLSNQCKEYNLFMGDQHCLSYMINMERLHQHALFPASAFVLSKPNDDEAAETIAAVADFAWIRTAPWSMEYQRLTKCYGKAWVNSLPTARAEFDSYVVDTLPGPTPETPYVVATQRDLKMLVLSSHGRVTKAKKLMKSIVCNETTGAISAVEPTPEHVNAKVLHYWRIHHERRFKNALYRWLERSTSKHHDMITGKHGKRQLEFYIEDVGASLEGRSETKVMRTSPVTS